MNIIVYGVIGLAFGDVMAYINSLITRRMLRTESMKMFLGAVFLRFFVDAFSLGVLFIAGRILGVGTTPLLVGGAVGLSSAGLFFLYRQVRTLEKENGMSVDEGVSSTERNSRSLDEKSPSREDGNRRAVKSSNEAAVHLENTGTIREEENVDVDQRASDADQGSL